MNIASLVNRSKLSNCVYRKKKEIHRYIDSEIRAEEIIFILNMKGKMYIRIDIRNVLSQLKQIARGRTNGQAGRNCKIPCERP